MTADGIMRGARAGLVLLLLAGAGCQRGGDAAAPAGPAKPAARPPVVHDQVDPAVAEANRRMAAAVPMGAGAAPVDARFELKSAPQPGHSFELEIAVLPQATSPVVHVELQPSEGLTIESPEGPVNFEKVQGGSLERLTVKATSAQPGTRVLGLRVTLELPSGAESREFAFPVIVGGGTPAVAPAGNPAR
jgi:hypothetical protein